MVSFILGMGSSLAAAGLTVAAGWLGRKRLRRWPLVLVSHIAGLGIRQAYSQQQLATPDLTADLERARWVKVLAGRGNELTRDTFQLVWKEVGMRLESVQILLPNPDISVGSFLVTREAELLYHDSGYKEGLLAEQVKANIDYVSTISNKSTSVQLRLFNAPNICRVVATDTVAYLTMYTTAAHGRNSPCLAVGNPGPLYDFALRIFSSNWDCAVTVGRNSS